MTYESNAARPIIGPAGVIGSRYRLTPGGPVCTTTHVSPACATARIDHLRPHPDPSRAAAGEMIRSTKATTISLRAAVYPTAGRAE